jgi:type II secretory pathway pseudopilin PulG
VAHTVLSESDGWCCGSGGVRNGGDDGQASIIEIVIAAVLIIAILVATAYLVLGQQGTSGSYRAVTHAQSIATAELAQLRSQAAAYSSTGIFPPADTDANSSWSAGGGNLTSTATYTDSGDTYTSYVLGGWCVLSTTTATTLSGGTYPTSDWGTYTSSAYTMSDPPVYWVAVVVTWGKPAFSETVSVSSGFRVVYTQGGSQSSNRLVYASAVAPPSGTTPPTSSSACPAELS